MNIHCTQKLAKKLPEVCVEPQEETSVLGSWHANLYTIDRRQCIMFCHDQTRFVLFQTGLKKSDFTNLDYLFQDLLGNTMLKCGYEPTLMEKALSHVDKLNFDTACNRSVQGSMRTVRTMELYAVLMDASDVMELPVYSVSAHLNDRPASIKGMKASECLWPIRAMDDLIRAL